MKHTNLRTDLPKSILEAIKDNFFYSSSYFNFLNQTSSPVFIYNKNHIVLVSIYKKYIFINAQFPVENICYNSEGNESPQVFLDAIMKYLVKEFKIQWTTPTNASAFFNTYPTNSLRIPFGSHVINLLDSEEELLQNMHGKHRNSVRKSEKSGVIIKLGGLDLLKDYLVLDKETWLRSGGVGMGNSYFYNLLSLFPDNIFLAIAYHNGTPQGGGFYFYNKSMSYYMYGASKNKPESGSMNLLQWKAILEMKRLNVKKFSFVGCRINEDENSKFHGIQRFKGRFGGELISGYMFKVIKNRFLYFLFNALLFMKSGKMSTDAIDQEIHKWSALNK
jgi:hypothetical protein